MGIRYESGEAQVAVYELRLIGKVVDRPVYICDKCGAEQGAVDATYSLAGFRSNKLPEAMIAPISFETPSGWSQVSAAMTFNGNFLGRTNTYCPKCSEAQAAELGYTQVKALEGE